MKPLSILFLFVLTGCQMYHGGPPTIVETYGGDRDYIWPDHSLCGNISGGSQFYAEDHGLYGLWGDYEFFLRREDAIAWLETKCTPGVRK